MATATTHSPNNTTRGNPALAVIAAYKAPKGQTAYIIAHFLDYAAKHAPNTFFSLQQITKAVRGLPSVPNARSIEVTPVKNSMTRAKELLRNTYKRGSTYLKGVGYRACVDSSDTNNTDLRQKASRFIATKRSLDKTAAIIDEKKLSPSEKKFYFDVVKASNLITENEIAKLLPPKLPPRLEAKKS